MADERGPSSSAHEFTVQRVTGPYDGRPYEGFCACGHRTGKQMTERDAEQVALNHQHAKGST